VLFPPADPPSVKTRPALVVQANDLGTGLPQRIVAMGRGGEFSVTLMLMNAVIPNAMLMNAVIPNGMLMNAVIPNAVRDLQFARLATATADGAVLRAPDCSSLRSG
jgi:hypothetical protein